MIYNGKTYLSTSAVEKMKTVVKMLGLKFPGGFDRQILSTPQVPASPQMFRVTESARTPAPPAEQGRSQSRSPARSGRKRSRSDSPEREESLGKKSRGSPGKVSATDR